MSSPSFFLLNIMITCILYLYINLEWVTIMSLQILLKRRKGGKSISVTRLARKVWVSSWSEAHKIYSLCISKKEFWNKKRLRSLTLKKLFMYRKCLYQIAHNRVWDLLLAVAWLQQAEKMTVWAGRGSKKILNQNYIFSEKVGEHV